jgi:hypothetical protein
MRPEDHPSKQRHNRPMQYPARCPARNLNGRMCCNRAGQGTNHPGYGGCFWHKGSQHHVEEAWKMAQELAAERNITPHEALLNLVRTATGRAAYVDTIISEQLRQHIADGGDPLKPPVEILRWMKQSREERRLAAGTAKQAVDAGVMVALERRLDMEGELVASALAAALDSLNLDPGQRMKALGAAQQHLLGAGELPAAG